MADIAAPGEERAQSVLEFSVEAGWFGQARRYAASFSVCIASTAIDRLCLRAV